MSNQKNNPLQVAENKVGVKSHPALIATARIQLRPLEVKDAETVFIYRNQPDVSLFQGWTPESIAEVAAYAEQMWQREPALAGHWYQVVLEGREGEIKNKIIGDVAFCIEPHSGQQAELGVALNVDYQRKGLAKEAILGLLAYLFEQLAMHRIHVCIDPRNVRSLNLFQKVGFRHEGHHRQSCWHKGEWTDDVVMAMLRSEWPDIKLSAE
ncbi:GNAT family N-acetyltransferase [Aliikangiella maris]|uniref:GNAT family protein n=2 Tax=Aliikangiella maris TaxID=3162458 RepID=A0ABV3MND9_9GAMM